MASSGGSIRQRSIVALRSNNPLYRPAAVIAGVTSANLIDDRVTVTDQGGGRYLVAGFNWVTGLEGDYTFSVAGGGIADAAGNTVPARPAKQAGHLCRPQRSGGL